MPGLHGRLVELLEDSRRFYHLVQHRQHLLIVEFDSLIDLDL
jgi:hypothetical protein